jgi:hypothetical protein
VSLAASAVEGKGVARRSVIGVGERNDRRARDHERGNHECGEQQILFHAMKSRQAALTPAARTDDNFVIPIRR